MKVSCVDDALEQLLDHGLGRTVVAPPEHAGLWSALVAATAGGKRFRPSLLVATHDALGGTAPASAARVGAAVELLHTAFVIHDDVIDGDDVRRGRLNVSGTYRTAALADGASKDGAEEIAHAAAILAGDLALTTAIRAVATCGAPRVVVDRLLDLFDEALRTTAAGELADVRLASSAEPAPLEECLAMAEHKTSAYSFGLPLTAGAVLAGACEESVEALVVVGRDLGLAFQLVDDLVGVFGDPTVSGKSTTNDLRSAKQTPLLAHAATRPEWSQLCGYLGRDLSVTELDEARAVLTASGSRVFVERLAEAHLVSARAALHRLHLPVELADAVVPAVAALAGVRGDEAAA